jgi:hypothetical protein
LGLSISDFNESSLISVSFIVSAISNQTYSPYSKWVPTRLSDRVSNTPQYFGISGQTFCKGWRIESYW